MRPFAAAAGLTILVGCGPTESESRCVGQHLRAEIDFPATDSFSTGCTAVSGNGCEARLSTSCAVEGVGCYMRQPIWGVYLLGEGNPFAAEGRVSITIGAGGPAGSPVCPDEVGQDECTWRSPGDACQFEVTRSAGPGGIAIAHLAEPCTLDWYAPGEVSSLPTVRELEVGGVLRPTLPEPPLPFACPDAGATWTR